MGLMLGEIRGKSAGEASIEVLDLFFGPRGAIDGVFLSLEVFMASIRGLASCELELLPFNTLGEGITRKGDFPLTELRVGVV